MDPRIDRIQLPLPVGLGEVNCYLLRADRGCILIDTGAPGARAAFCRQLEQLGCRPGDLGLVLLTHGDFDHIGNAAHLRGAHGCPIAMHAADARAAAAGDMFANRRKSYPLLAALTSRLFGFGSTDRFEADVLVDDGFSLLPYGLDATVLALPGHSPGSIGLLTAGGDLFCGDLLDNPKGPAVNTLLDDAVAAQSSVDRLRSMAIRTVHPGHGEPFAWDELRLPGAVE